ncbi:serine hydrolase, partial [Porticoccaceae bacterium]|nr:serine hydrolase [Porticoccaceae bacterium]
LFTPLGMTNSLFQQPLPESYHGSAASGHHANGTVVPGRHNHHPELAAAGLWSTPSDLAKIILAVNAIALSEEGALLSPASGQDFLSVQARGAGGPWGLGFGLHEQDGEVIGFHHGGDNVGFHGHMVGFLNGSGAVIMTNGDQGPALIQELLAATAALYQWPVHQVKEKNWQPLSTEYQSLVSGTYTVTIGEQTHQLKLEPVDDAVTGHALKLCSEDEPDVVFYLEEIKDKTLQFFATIGALMSINCEKEQQPVLNAFGEFLIKE